MKDTKKPVGKKSKVLRANGGGEDRV
jgi:hypothetical protein